MVFPLPRPPLSTPLPDGGLLLPTPDAVEEQITRLTSEITVLRKLKRVVKRMSVINQDDQAAPKVSAVRVGRDVL